MFLYRFFLWAKPYVYVYKLILPYFYRFESHGEHAVKIDEDDDGRSYTNFIFYINLRSNRFAAFPWQTSFKMRQESCQLFGVSQKLLQ